jgi:hypothetical protein
MSADDVRELIPRNKHDLERARAAVALGYPAVAPILPELLKWLQDMNWPVARVLAPFLASIGAPLAPEVQRILATDDAMWKYWVVKEIVARSPWLAAALAPQLRELATLESDDEDDAEVRDAAAEVLSRLQKA